MKGIHNYSFEDEKIKHISIYGKFVELLFEQWNNIIIRLLFEEYWRIKDIHSVDESVGELIINSSSLLIEEVLKDIVDGFGSEEETKGLKSYSFMSLWGDRTLFEIVARNVKVEEIEK